MAHTTFTFTKTQTNNILTAARISAKSRKDMLPIATEWRAADGGKQEAMCKSFMLLWIQGVVGCDEEQSEIILSAGKGRSAINPAAIDAARSAFRYNVITNGVIEQVEAPIKAKASNHAPVKASKAEAAIIALVLSSMTKARALELLAAAK